MRIEALPRLTLQRDDSNPEGRHYLIPQGKWVMSVTNWLDQATDPAGIEEWRERVGHKRADSIRHVAATRGNLLHEAIEHFLETKEEPDFDFLLTPYWNSARPWILQIEHAVLVEAPVFHPDGFAGTIDFLGYLKLDKGLLTLNDWKSADKPLTPIKEYRYKMQQAAYVKALEYNYSDYDLRVDRARLIVALPDEEAHEIVMDRDELHQLYIHFLNQRNYHGRYKR